MSRITAEPENTIIIAGGGIGGLAAALALANIGFNCRVFEKRDDNAEDGAGIQIGPNGVKALAALGVRDALEPLAAKPDALIVHDGASNRVLTRQPLGAWIEDRFAAPYWTLHRADLHRALHTAASTHGRIEISAGCAVTGFKNGDDHVDVYFADGTSITTHALIAADGLWSELRTAIASAPPPTPIGKSAFRATLALSDVATGIDPNAVHLWLAPGAHAVMYPVRGGAEHALVIIAPSTDTGTTWGRKAEAADITAAIGPFAPPFRLCGERTQNWRRWTLFAADPFLIWNDGRAALLGDAAHPVLPFLAQGAVMALEDALTLAACLQRFADNVPAALLAYAAIRRPRTAKVAAAAKRNGDIYHLSGAFALARNLTLSAMPSGRLIKSYDWLYGAEI